MTSGPRLFAQFARPPNSLGYCGPDEPLLRESLPMEAEVDEEISRAAPAFEGAWPYLQLIGDRVGLDALALEVVRAYWLGSRLLPKVGINDWGASLRDRFANRAGTSWPRIADAVEAGGVPHHSFHVYCVYPWIGMLREGVVEPSLHVLDRCRIRVGRVIERGSGDSLVTVCPLTWDGRKVGSGVEGSEWVRNPLAAQLPEVGDFVALHWDEICDVISASEARRLGELDRHHLRIANRLGLEPV